MRHYGVRHLQDLRDRCYVDPDTGCWVWRLSKTHDGQARVHWRRPDGSVLATTGGRVAWQMVGRGIPEGHVVYRVKCHNKACTNPYHMACGPKPEAGAHLRKAGYLKGDIARAIVNGRNRRGSDKPASLVNGASVFAWRAAA